MLLRVACCCCCCVLLFLLYFLILKRYTVENGQPLLVTESCESIAIAYFKTNSLTFKTLSVSKFNFDHGTTASSISGEIFSFLIFSEFFWFRDLQHFCRCGEKSATVNFTSLRISFAQNLPSKQCCSLFVF